MVSKKNYQAWISDMNYQELLEKYNSLMEEKTRLERENRLLKAQIGLPILENAGISTTESESEKNLIEDKSTDRINVPKVDNTSDIPAKVHLFMSLFRGRRDVYAERWENLKKEISGYVPVCLNQWRPGVCEKPKITCSKCKQKSYAPLDEAVIENHLRGDIVVGVYPMLLDETCWFLAMDFDGKEWQKDVSVIRKVCNEFNIPVAVERSRSGNGGHAWFFF